MSNRRVIIAGVSGGSGKTLISLGIAAAFRRRRRRVAPFKKGPDFIDAAWLSVAADRPCRNLDLFFMPPPTIIRSVSVNSRTADVAVIEGNRGLYDGLDAEGSCSTAQLAKLLRTPVVLVLDCTKMTATAAAVILGCQRLDPEVDIRGVILNRASGGRHEAILRGAIERNCALPVLGSLGKVDEPGLPDRHLGLVPPQENNHALQTIERAAALAERLLDLDAIWEIAGTAPDLPAPPAEAAPRIPLAKEPIRIAVFRDAAFHFYYPENLEALEAAGARLIETSPVRDPELPDADALYIGGGFPEAFAPELGRNKRFAASLRTAADDGMPVYAECGGLVYLGRRLAVGHDSYAMAGVLPVSFVFGQRPAGHGYSVLETIRDNPFFDLGMSVRGHEFHYTRPEHVESDELAYSFSVRRGHGFDGRRDGLCRRNVLASYTHVHALGVEGWAPAVVSAAARSASGG